MNVLLFARAYLLLIRIELLIRFRSLKAVHSLVKRQPVATNRARRSVKVADLCRAIDLAAMLYWKTVLCLQRSAAATVLLRSHGWPAEMVIGVQILPFQSHAWVEIDGMVVNDKPYMREIYRVLERCEAD